MLRRLFLLIAFAVPGICTVLGLLPGSRRKSEALSSVKLKDGRRLAYELRGRTNAKHVAFWNHGIISSRSIFAMLSIVSKRCRALLHRLFNFSGHDITCELARLTSNVHFTGWKSPPHIWMCWRSWICS